MKSDRRHALQENSLIRWVRNFPNFWRESGSKTMLGVIAILLVIVLVRWFITSRSEKAERVAANLSAAQALLTEWREANITALMRTNRFAEGRGEVREKLQTAVSAVLSESTDTAQQAEAKLIRADLYLELAQAGDAPESATRPSERPKESSAELFQGAAKDYSDVLNQPGLPARLAARARFGLASVAEDKQDWSAARNHYETIARDDRLPKSLRDLATDRQISLSKLQEPVILGRPRKPVPTSMPLFNLPNPATTNPATMPTAPTTMPAVTQPAAGPVP